MIYSIHPILCPLEPESRAFILRSDSSLSPSKPIRVPAPHPQVPTLVIMMSSLVHTTKVSPYKIAQHLDIPTFRTHCIRALETHNAQLAPQIRTRYFSRGFNNNTQPIQDIKSKLFNLGFFTGAQIAYATTTTLASDTPCHVLGSSEAHRYMGIR